MAHFAKLDENNVVLEIHVVNNEDIGDTSFPQSETAGIVFLTNWANGEIFNWRQTSYNGNFRKNYASVGYTYDVTRDAFIAPSPYPSWVLEESTCQWKAPIDPPKDVPCRWDEETKNWVEITE